MIASIIIFILSCVKHNKEDLSHQGRSLAVDTPLSPTSPSLMKPIYSPWWQLCLTNIDIWSVTESRRAWRRSARYLFLIRQSTPGRRERTAETTTGWYHRLYTNCCCTRPGTGSQHYQGVQGAPGAHHLPVISGIGCARGMRSARRKFRMTNCDLATLGQ